MGLPRILLVDDSEAMLAVEVAALSGLYELATAHDGREGLEKLRSFFPDLAILDLSMPHLRGDQVLREVADDPVLCTIPLVICSSETERKAECLRAGAKAFLGKPVDARTLQDAVASVLAQERRRREEQGLAAVFVKVGTLEIGLPLIAVKSVLHQVATRLLPVGPAYLSEFAELLGEPVLVLDLARRFGVAHAKEVQDRKLVLCDIAGATLALCADEVRDPEEIPADALIRRHQMGGNKLGSVALLGMARTDRGVISIVDPSAFASPQMLHELRSAIGAA